VLDEALHRILGEGPYVHAPGLRQLLEESADPVAPVLDAADAHIREAVEDPVDHQGCHGIVDGAIGLGDASEGRALEGLQVLGLAPVHGVLAVAAFAGVEGHGDPRLVDARPERVVERISQRAAHGPRNRGSPQMDQARVPRQCPFQLGNGRVGIH
jgi:hypothetical protein